MGTKPEVEVEVTVEPGDDPAAEQLVDAAEDAAEAAEEAAGAAEEATDAAGEVIDQATQLDALIATHVERAMAAVHSRLDQLLAAVDGARSTAELAEAEAHEATITAAQALDEAHDDGDPLDVLDEPPVLDVPEPPPVPEVDVPPVSSVPPLFRRLGKPKKPPQ